MIFKYGAPISHIDDLRTLVENFLPGSDILEDGHGGIVIDTKCDMSLDGYLCDRDDGELIPSLNELSLVK